MIQATITKPLQELRDAIKAEDKGQEHRRLCGGDSVMDRRRADPSTAQRPKLYSGGGGGG